MAEYQLSLTGSEIDEKLQNAVLFSEQTLSDEQKEQFFNNTDAVQKALLMASQYGYFNQNGLRWNGDYNKSPRIVAFDIDGEQIPYAWVSDVPENFSYFKALFGGLFSPEVALSEWMLVGVGHYTQGTMVPLGQDKDENYIIYIPFSELNTDAFPAAVVIQTPTNEFPQAGIYLAFLSAYFDNVEINVMYITYLSFPGIRFTQSSNSTIILYAGDVVNSQGYLYRTSDTTNPANRITKQQLQSYLESGRTIQLKSYDDNFSLTLYSQALETIITEDYGVVFMQIDLVGGVTQAYYTAEYDPATSTTLNLNPNKEET